MGIFLVQENDNKISGIVTATDLSDQFRKLSEPFLMIREIEGHLRNLIGANFEISNIKEVLSEILSEDDLDKISGVEDLSFGNYWYILENAGRWAKTGLNVDRVQFINLMKAVNDVRNDAMHFRPKGLSDENIAILNEAASFLQRLSQAGAM